MLEWLIDNLSVLTDLLVSFVLAFFGYKITRPTGEEKEQAKQNKQLKKLQKLQTKLQKTNDKINTEVANLEKVENVSRETKEGE